MPPRFKLFLVVSYVAILVTAAWPPLLPIPLLDRVSPWVYKQVRAISILPGHRVFYHAYDDRIKNRSRCVQIKMQSPDGLVVPLYQTELTCRPGGLRLFADEKMTLILRLFDEMRMIRGKPRERAIHTAIGEYFCHSKLVDRGYLRAESVTWIWFNGTIDYVTGQKNTAIRLLAKWDCSKRELAYSAWDHQVDLDLAQAFFLDQPW